MPNFRLPANPTDLAQWIYEQATALGLRTYADVGAKAQLSPTTIKNIVGGKTVSLVSLDALAHWFHEERDTLIGKAGDQLEERARRKLGYITHERVFESVDPPSRDPRLSLLPAWVVDFIRELRARGASSEVLEAALEEAIIYVRSDSTASSSGIASARPPSDRRRRAANREDLPDSEANNVDGPPQARRRHAGEVPSSDD